MKNMNSLEMVFSKHFHQKISQDFIGSHFLHEKRLQQRKMHVSYRKGLDSCIQSGVGWVIAIFFDLCNQILYRSPATDSMSSGLDVTVDSTDAQSHSFESRNENTTFQSLSSIAKQLLTIISQTNLMRIKILKVV